MEYNLIFCIFIGLLSLIVINNIFELGIFNSIKKALFKIANYIVTSIGNYNVKRYVERIKREKFRPKKDNLFTKYNTVIENLIFDFNLPITLEGFNSLICLLFAILVILVLVFLRSVSLSSLVSIAIIIGLITFFTMQSRISRAQKIESIMDAEDLICPMAKEGVLIAIKKVLESEEYINRSIRHYFVQFVENCENHGYSFKSAMQILNRQLGPKFNNFAKKAIIFEYNERKGMAEIFNDIVDENAVLREINVRKNRVFKKMNRDFLIKTALVVIFVSYSMTFENIRNFMINDSIGRFINTMAVIAICLSFARLQTLQNDIGNVGGDV